MTRRFLCLAALLVAAPAGAQLPAWNAGAGASFELYHFNSPEQVDIRSLSLITVPLRVRASLTHQVSVELTGAYARGRIERVSAPVSTLQGLTDTELRVSVGLKQDAVTITGIAQLPTGTSQLSLAELDVAGAVAADVLPFAISNWGTGGGLGISTALAAPVGSFATGLSVGYVVAREYEPLDADAFLYRPGNQLHVRAAIDRTVGSAGKVALQLSMLHYQQDRLNGDNLYQPGSRWQASGSYAFAAGARASGIAYLGYLRRDRGDYTDAVRITPARNLFFAGAGMRMPAGSGMLEPRLDLRVENSQDGIGQGYTVGLGGAGSWPAGENLELVPTLRGRFGSVELRQGARSAFVGAELGLALRFGSR